jgi:hypothetical protein
MTLVETVQTIDKTIPFHIIKSKRTPVIGDVMLFQTPEGEEISFDVTHVLTGDPKNHVAKGYHVLGWVSRVEITQ